MAPAPWVGSPGDPKPYCAVSVMMTRAFFEVPWLRAIQSTEVTMPAVPP